MAQVVELASEAEGFAEHGGGLPPAAGAASRHIAVSGLIQRLISFANRENRSVHRPAVNVDRVQRR